MAGEISLMWAARALRLPLEKLKSGSNRRAGCCLWAPGVPLHRFLSIMSRKVKSCQRGLRCSFEVRGQVTSRRSSKNRKADEPQVEFPLAESSGFLVRDANRAFQRLLEKRIAPYGVARGQWYFLRVLWNEDGLSQRELSARVGTMEPTTVIALRTMEKSGLIRRVRSTDDKRRSHVWLTPKAQQLRTELLALARGITDAAEVGVTPDELALFRRVIARMTANLDRIKT
jgi:DNA-binding MarR family transcriptional regulator